MDLDWTGSGLSYSETCSLSSAGGPEQKVQIDFDHKSGGVLLLFYQHDEDLDLVLEHQVQFFFTCVKV